MQKEVCLPQYRPTFLQTWTSTHLRQHSPRPRKVSRVLHIFSFFFKPLCFSGAWTEGSFSSGRQYDTRLPQNGTFPSFQYVF